MKAAASVSHATFSKKKKTTTTNVDDTLTIRSNMLSAAKSFVVRRPVILVEHLEEDLITPMK